MTKHLVLRQPVEADVGAMVDALSDFGISRNLARVPYPYHRDDALDFLRFVAGSNGRSRFSAIALREEPSQLIGMISYEWSEGKQDAEFGYWLARAQWGKGLMTEAAQVMVDHAFGEDQIPLLISCFHDDNPVSGKILSRVGFERVGACMHYSRAQGRELPVTNMRYERERWLQTKNAGM
mgnify:CR=1 FL=1